VYCDRRLPAAVRSDEVAVGECLGGALYVNDFLRLCREVGRPLPRPTGGGGHLSTIRPHLGARAPKPPDPLAPRPCP
jgi:hypothetical protein